MVRATSEQIDAVIVDRAAGLFARHGLKNTSVQQIADATGYSKAGVLRRFATKDALFDAAVAAAGKAATAVAARIDDVPPGIDRDRAVVNELVDLTTQWPGVSALLTSCSEMDVDDASEELLEAGDSIMRAFRLDPLSADEDRAVRVLSATAGLTLASLTAVRVDCVREWRPSIVATALNTLGYHD